MTCFDLPPEPSFAAEAVDLMARYKASHQKWLRNRGREKIARQRIDDPFHAIETEVYDLIVQGIEAREKQRRLSASVSGSPEAVPSPIV